MEINHKPYRNLYIHIITLLCGIVFNLINADLAFAMVINHDQSSSATKYGDDVLSQTDNQMCKPGYVFQDNTCVQCVSNPTWLQYAREKRIYCPGLTFGNINLPLEQQIATCSSGAQPNADLSDCECIYKAGNTDCNKVDLTSEQLKCGPGGCTGKPLYKQCWTKNNHTSYKACMGF